MTDSPRLYVYGGPDLLAHLKRNLLPLTTWQTLANPWFADHLGIGHETEITSDQWQAALERRYAAIPEHLRAAVDFPYFAQQMEARRPELEAEIQASGELDPAGTLDLARHRGVVVLRLLETPLNPLGWQLLGDAHRGVCIGVSKGLPAFQAAPSRPRLLRHVRYTPHRTMAASDNMPLPGWYEEPEAMAPLNEWRLALPQRHARDHKSGPALALPSGSVTELYIGALANDETVQAVRDLQRLYLPYRQATRFRIHAAERSFTLQASRD